MINEKLTKALYCYITNPKRLVLSFIIFTTILAVCGLIVLEEVTGHGITICVSIILGNLAVSGISYIITIVKRRYNDKNETCTRPRRRL